MSPARALLCCCFVLILAIHTEARRKKTEQATKSAPSIPPEITEQIVKGEGLYNAKKYLEAKTLFSSLMKKHGNAQPNIFFWHALSSLETEDHRAAIQSADKYLSLAAEPHYLAYTTLGRSYEKLREYKKSAEYMEKGCKAQPADLLCQFDLARMFENVDKRSKSSAIYDRLIKERPEEPMPYNNIGLNKAHVKDFESAVAYYRRGLAVSPGNPVISVNLGAALQELKRYDEAVEALTPILTSHPQYAFQAHYNLGRAKYEGGNATAAEEHFRAALAADSASSLPWMELGMVYHTRERFDEALAALETANRLNPHHAETLVRLGNTLRSLHRLQQAIDMYKEAAAADPKHNVALQNIGNVYYQMADYVQAVVYFTKATDLESDSEVLAMLAFSQKMLCDWEGERASVSRLKEKLQADFAKDELTGMLGIEPLTLLTFDLEPNLVTQCTKVRADAMETKVKALGATPAPTLKLREGEKIRIGYVSSDLSDHPVGMLMRSVFALHDRSRFTIYAYNIAEHTSTAHQVFMDSADHWVDLSNVPSLEAAARIRRDGIHFLVNLNGWTKGHRNEIFAARPAPIQLCYLGYVATCGADYLQYILTDARASPDVHATSYTEHRMLMPNSYQVNNHKQNMRWLHERMPCASNKDAMCDGQGHALPSRASLSIPEDAFVFACFNQVWKITEEMFGDWMTILRRVPGSVLWLLRNPSPHGEPNLRAAAVKAGMGDRVIFGSFLNHDEYLRRALLADVFLDTSLYNAGTVGSDMLWAGVPVVTLPGDTMAARMGASLLTAAGMPELIATSRDNYMELAVRLGTDGAYLASVRERLNATRSSAPLFDTSQWVKDFETGIAEAVRLAADGQPPRDIRI